MNYHFTFTFVLTFIGIYRRHTLGVKMRYIIMLFLHFTFLGLSRIRLCTPIEKE